MRSHAPVWPVSVRPVGRQEDRKSVRHLTANYVRRSDPASGRPARLSRLTRRRLGHSLLPHAKID
jgi:hypothetical protein